LLESSVYLGKVASLALQEVFRRQAILPAFHAQPVLSLSTTSALPAAKDSTPLDLLTLALPVLQERLLLFNPHHLLHAKTVLPVLFRPDLVASVCSAVLALPLVPRAQPLMTVSCALLVPHRFQVVCVKLVMLGM
jgi:hypothetical protein